MNPDPLDQLAARLFEAAREEPLPDHALERLLAAAHGPTAPSPARLPWSAGMGTGMAVTALAASFVLFFKHDEPVSRISAEPSRSHAPVLAPPSTTSAPPLDSAPIVAKALPSASLVRPVVSAPVSLDDELSALKLASSSLEAGNTQAALAALDRYDRVLKGKKLRAEATVLRIEALAQGGEGGAASALAQRFVSQNPESPLVDRARSFIKPQ